ncbi:PREDICTED: uncharacterized protein LOC109388725 [Hipposideros armiger]|uniref:Uncharacterized protein LOC109388725 n=1 Tax=Hipposideros armiger TaxID=186990 RepID=A0A8B7S8L7_HIPAR|nr:PREDICTED: uncharacterized protein LOC109388725 [Hipposideros armiger]
MLSDVKETMRKSLDKTSLEWFGRGLGHLPLFQLDFPGRVSQQLETSLAQGQSSFVSCNFVLLSPLCHLSHPLSLGTLTSSLELNQGSSAEPSLFHQLELSPCPPCHSLSWLPVFSYPLPGFQQLRKKNHKPENPIQDTTLYSLFASPSSSPACDKSLRLSWSFIPLALLKNIGQDILIGCTPSFGIERLAKDGVNKQGHQLLAVLSVPPSCQDEPFLLTENHQGRNGNTSV